MYFKSDAVNTLPCSNPGCPYDHPGYPFLHYSFVKEPWLLLSLTVPSSRVWIPSTIWVEQTFTFLLHSQECSAKEGCHAIPGHDGFGVIRSWRCCDTGILHLLDIGKENVRSRNIRVVRGGCVGKRATVLCHDDELSHGLTIQKRIRIITACGMMFCRVSRFNRAEVSSRTQWKSYVDGFANY